MSVANITSIVKNRKSRLSLDNERGIFILSILRNIHDKLLYNELFTDIDQRMSDSNA